MKKLLLSLPFMALLFLAPQVTRAGACYQDPIYELNETYTAKSAVFVRSDACMDGTSIVATLNANEQVQGIAKTDGWLKVRRADGTEGWSGETFFQPNATVSLTKEPLWDVGNHPYKDAIWNLYNAGIVSGNDTDKSYQPDSLINRAAFAKIAIGATTFSVPKNTTGCLKDIAPGLWYSDFICYANSTLIGTEPIIKGHPDGYFRPEDKIRFSELSKIVALLYGLKSGEGQVWYEGYIQALSDVNAIPPSLKNPEQFVTRAEMAEIMDRLIQGDLTRSSTQFNYSINNKATGDSSSADLALCVNAATPEVFDYTLLESKALELTNQARAKRGLSALNQSQVLNASSTVWALNGQFTHTRPQAQSLLDYETNIGITGLKAFGENLGQYSFTCQNQDCTQDALVALEEIHQLFMDEESLPEGERGHFENIVGDYDSMGFGISVQNNALLLVFQYGKSITADETVLCANLK